MYLLVDNVYVYEHHAISYSILYVQHVVNKCPLDNCMRLTKRTKGQYSRRRMFCVKGFLPASSDGQQRVYWLTKFNGSLVN